MLTPNNLANFYALACLRRISISSSNFRFFRIRFCFCKIKISLLNFDCFCFSFFSTISSISSISWSGPVPSISWLGPAWSISWLGPAWSTSKSRLGERLNSGLDEADADDDETLKRKYPFDRDRIQKQVLHKVLSCIDADWCCIEHHFSLENKWFIPDIAELPKLKNSVELYIFYNPKDWLLAERN